VPRVRPTSSPSSPRPPAAGGAAVRSIAGKLSAAAARCRARGAQLTALRREVLELLLRRGGCAKAYDLQEDLRQRRGRIAPTTVYRALEFLMEHQLAHRVDALAAFAACDLSEPHPQVLLVVCSACGEVSEWHDEEAREALGARLRRAYAGFRESTVEIKGRCAACR
jgi:Fur family zinc uptake transcriptional regulator